MLIAVENSDLSYAGTSLCVVGIVRGRSFKLGFGGDGEANDRNFSTETIKRFRLQMRWAEVRGRRMERESPQRNATGSGASQTADCSTMTGPLSELNRREESGGLFTGEEEERGRVFFLMWKQIVE